MKKSLVQTAITLLFALIIFTFVLQPSRYIKAFFDGLTVWAHNVLPVLFPFALLTTLYAKNRKEGNFSLAKLLFGIPCDNTLFTSFLCGYPVGAKAISEQNVDSKTATTMCSFCSTPGPIFVIATVGTALGDTTATIVVCIAQLVAMILNGWLYTKGKELDFATKQQTLDSKIFAETLTNSILSVLTVGGLIALFFMFTEMIQALLPTPLATHPAIFFLVGMLEMTSGILQICQTCDTFVATVCTSALLSFGGLCVALQCFTYLSQKGVTFANLVKLKCTQCAFATIVAFALGKLFL